MKKITRKETWATRVVATLSDEAVRAELDRLSPRQLGETHEQRVERLMKIATRAVRLARGRRARAKEKPERSR